MDWLDEKVVLGLTWNDIGWVAAGIVLGALYILFPLDWNAVFGLR